MDRPLVAFDTETSAHQGAPHLIELGAVRVVAGEVVEHFQRLVRPAVPIEPEATATHGITDADVRGADDASTVLASFFEWVADDWLVAHNARADAHVIGFECARHELDAPANPLLDSLKLARRMLPDAPDHRLPTLVEHLELEIEELHRALPDATACWKVLEASLEQLGGWDTVSDAWLLEAAAVPVNLATARPLRPRRRPSLLRALERARREERSVWLLYGDADETTARLEVLPRLLYRNKERSYLEGECVRSGLLKTYRLDRLQRVEA